jgi:hypothetical protein
VDYCFGWIANYIFLFQRLAMQFSVPLQSPCNLGCWLLLDVRAAMLAAFLFDREYKVSGIISDESISVA